MSRERGSERLKAAGTYASLDNESSETPLPAVTIGTDAKVTAACGFNPCCFAAFDAAIAADPTCTRAWSVSVVLRVAASDLGQLGDRSGSGRDPDGWS